MNLQSQTFSSKIVDGKSKKPIPYATIEYAKNKGVISNEEGRFNFVLDTITTKKLDSVYITSLGYQKTGFTYENLLDSIIYIEPKAIELGGVYVFNKDLSIDEILENVEKNLDRNHKNSFLKKRFFLRQSYTDLLNKIDVEFIKSTIAELDKKLIDSVVNAVPRQSTYFTETLGDLYTNASDNNSNKLSVIKAAELYNKENEISGEAMQERFEKILEQNVKQDSYLKIKSGWFSTKIQVDSIIENTDEAESIEEKEPEKTNFVPNRKYALKIMHDRMFIKKSNLDVIRKLSKYEFSLAGYTDIENAGVYILNFKPKNRADFEGKLYINVEDFAIMRIDYDNVKSLKKVKLLGFSYNHHTYKGSTVFTKDPTGAYTVKFATFENGSSFGVKRPLKIVEKNKNVKGRRKQNELKLKLDVTGNNYSKYELVVYDVSKSDAATLKSLTEEKNIKPQYLPSYNPEFWKGYTIMEPNQAIKEFTITETD